MTSGFTGLAGKIVLVTGGSRGIGRSIAESFARQGSQVVITYAQSSSKADELVTQLKGEGHKIAAYQVDVADHAAMSNFVDQVHKEFGGVDVLVNNAGIIRDNLLLMMADKDWTDVIQTNLNGCFNAMKPVSKIMLRKRSGVIINMSSIAGSKPGRGHANYAASKGGIESLTKALAAELGSKNVRVNCVAPGMIETDMSVAVRDAAGEKILESIALRRFGKPEDIANAVLFLASDQASYITGAVLHVDGGL